MNKALSILAVAAIFVIGFFALNSYIYNEKQGDGPPQGEIGENLEGEADPSRMTLGMKDWIWVSALYNDGREITPNKPSVFTLVFEQDGRFTATTDCNSMGGSYTASGSTITFAQIGSTKMFCEGSQEAEFASLLKTTAGYHFTSRGQLILDLKFDSGSAVFR